MSTNTAPEAAPPTPEETFIPAPADTIEQLRTDIAQVDDTGEWTQFRDSFESRIQKLQITQQQLDEVKALLKEQWERAEATLHAQAHEAWGSLQTMIEHMKPATEATQENTPEQADETGLFGSIQQKIQGFLGGIAIPEPIKKFLGIESGADGMKMVSRMLKRGFHQAIIAVMGMVPFGFFTRQIEMQKEQLIEMDAQEGLEDVVAFEKTRNPDFTLPWDSATWALWRSSFEKARAANPALTARTFVKDHVIAYIDNTKRDANGAVQSLIMRDIPRPGVPAAQEAAPAAPAEKPFAERFQIENSEEGKEMEVKDIPITFVDSESNQNSIGKTELTLRGKTYDVTVTDNSGVELEGVKVFFIPKSTDSTLSDSEIRYVRETPRGKDTYETTVKNIVNDNNPENEEDIRVVFDKQ